MNSPSKFVTVPFVVPFSMTLAPIIGSPEADRIFPVIVFFFCNVPVVVSYIGYLSTELVPGSKTDLTISLKEDSQNLDEIVVVGYGVSRKKDLTGAVSVLKIDDLKDTPVSSVDQMM